jgi:hypothetical protein
MLKDIWQLVKSVPEEFRPQVAHVVRERIRTAPTAPLNEVLPSIYVMDCIVKLVGGSFVQLFAEGLKELFMDGQFFLFLFFVLYLSRDARLG